jgi:hypothetical protein
LGSYISVLAFASAPLEVPVWPVPKILHFLQSTDCVCELLLHFILHLTFVHLIFPNVKRVAFVV